MKGTRLFAAAVVALGALLPAAAPGPAAARAQTHHVEVRSNFFFPNDVRIAPGDTIVWTAQDNGHTITAEDRRFDWPPANRQTQAGESFSFTFPVDETVRFYCRVHGAFGAPLGTSMVGRIVVGTGGAAQPSPPPAPQTRIVPTQYATLAAALDGIPRGSTVRVMPGVYADPPSLTSIAQATGVVAVRDVTVEGAGATPADVVLDGAGPGVRRPSGIVVAADGVTIRNLTLRRYGAEGIAVRSVAGATVESVVVRDAGDAGIVVSDSSGVAVRGVTASGARLAAIMLKSCRACATLVESSVAEDSLYGVLADDVAGVTIRSSTIRGNATGVAVRSLPAERETAAADVRIEDNAIAGNAAPRAAWSPLDFPVRSGVWLAGVSNVRVERNAIDGHDYGILVATTSVPAVFIRIDGNVVTGSARADAGIDGIGAGICVAGNQWSTTRPALAETIYDCSLPTTVGVPELSVIADLARYAAG